MTTSALTKPVDTVSLEAKVKEVIFEVCEPQYNDRPTILAPEHIYKNHTLIGDLGAWTIDFLDLEFRLQKAFDIGKLATDREHVRLRDDPDLRAAITVDMVINRVKERVRLRGI